MLPREFVAARKRDRIMDAIASLSAEQGYEATTIADLVKRARVARKTLYDNFDGKEEVYLAAVDRSIEEALGRVEAACQGAGEDWSARVEASLRALLAYFAERPEEAQMCLIDARSATPASAARYDAAVQRLIELLRQAAPAHESLPGTTAETLVGGVAWILNQQVRRGEIARAPELAPELLEFLAFPYHGVGNSSTRGSRRK